jgi:FAD/FMN-containing dehydrogenase
MQTGRSTVTPPTAGSSTAFADLRRLCGGAVYLPGDPRYDEARRPWNLRADDRPAVVAYPAFPDEVAELVRAAAAAGLRIAPQGTGHGAPPLSGRLADAVLLRTSAMTELRIDAARRTARVGAGVLWGDVIGRAGAARLACRHMSSPSVGVVGSSLGGGLNWYGRSYGLQCSAVTAVEVVLADGSVVRATDDRDSDLLWAARGGGGGFGVVTALEFDLIPVVAPYAGMLVWEWAHARRVIDAWAQWAVDAPDEATSVLRLVRAPDVSWLPDGVRGRTVIVIDGAIVGDPRAAAEIIAPLRALRPEIDTFDVTPAASLARMHLEPEEPLAAYASSTLLAGLPPNAVEALVGAAGPDSGSELLFAEVRQLGGALSRPSPRGGALDRIDGAFLVLTLGAGESPGGWATQRADAERVLDAVQPWGTGALYLAMIDDHVDERRAVPTAQWERLNRVRLAADPDGRFVVPHFSSGKPGAASVK